MPQAENKKPATTGRETLKGLFDKGSMPGESSFAALIDSTLNLVDDGIKKTLEDGLQLAPMKSGQKGKRLVSFYNQIGKLKPGWSIDMAPALLNQSKEASQLCFNQLDGNGKATPVLTLDPAGPTMMKARLGAYNKNRSVPADGNWQTMASGLKGCNAFEVVARAKGTAGQGRYALIQAIVCSTYADRVHTIPSRTSKGNWIRRLLSFFSYTSHSEININQSYYGGRGSKLQLRLRSYEVRSKEDYPFRYDLEIRTKKNYGEDGKIDFSLMQLWDDKFELPENKAKS